MEILPAEIYPIILSYADFSLWRTARYVSRKWNSIIAANQHVQIWNFIREGRLPNGTRHGSVNRIYFGPIRFYDIFRYGNKIAREIYTNNEIIEHELSDKTGLISFIKRTQDYCVSYRLRFQTAYAAFFYINFNRCLDIEIISVKDCKYFCTHAPFLFTKK